MSLRLAICNPTHDRWRAGHITIPWHQIEEAAAREGLASGRVVVRGESGGELPSQVDEFTLNSLPRRTLSLTLDRNVRPGCDDYSVNSSHVTVEEGSPSNPARVEPKLEPVTKGGQVRGYKLSNGKLIVYFNLRAGLDDPRAPHPVYAGAVTSVQLNGREVMDYDTANAFAHHHQKRIQLDFIELPRAAWDYTDTQTFRLFNQDYELIDSFAGPVRAGLVVASQPFEYRYWDPFAGQERTVACRLYRVVSLYAGERHLIEELFVEGVPQGGGGGILHLHFTAHYFAFLHYLDLRVSRFKHIPDWFAVSNLMQPFQGYGFATDVHVRSVRWPHPGFLDRDDERGSLSWFLHPARYARCLHLFTRCEGPAVALAGDSSLVVPDGVREQMVRSEIESHAGGAWYDHIYKPLIARPTE